MELATGDDLRGERAPKIVGVPIKVRATVDAQGRDGVIIAHGGTAVGFALYLDKGHLAFAVRRDGELTVASASEPLPAGKIEVGAELRRDGAMVVLVAGQEVARAQAGGLIDTEPKDGLQVGRDLHAPVGPYEAPNPFGGTIEHLVLTLGE
jgi:arylsulfatase